MACVRVALVNPAYTSQTCSRCGHCEKANRKSQAKFLCVRCGYSAHADLNAAVNISRAAVIPPDAAALAG
jgi:putative transposase